MVLRISYGHLRAISAMRPMIGHDGSTVLLEWDMNAATVLRSPWTNPAHRHALDRVREWVRVRFSLGDTAILVAEVACAVPGCPPIEIVIAFWSEERRHHFKVFKPVAEVTEDDLPPRWYLPALAVPDDFECSCCG
jgi:nitrate reductase delta subunit